MVELILQAGCFTGSCDDDDDDDAAAADDDDGQSRSTSATRRVTHYLQFTVTWMLFRPCYQSLQC